MHVVYILYKSESWTSFIRTSQNTMVIPQRRILHWSRYPGISLVSSNYRVLFCESRTSSANHRVPLLGVQSVKIIDELAEEPYEGLLWSVQLDCRRPGFRRLLLIRTCLKLIWGSNAKGFWRHLYSGLSSTKHPYAARFCLFVA